MRIDMEDHALSFFFSPFLFFASLHQPPPHTTSSSIGRRPFPKMGSRARLTRERVHMHTHTLPHTRFGRCIPCLECLYPIEHTHRYYCFFLAEKRLRVYLFKKLDPAPHGKVRSPLQNAGKGQRFSVILYIVHTKTRTLPKRRKRTTLSTLLPLTFL